MAEELGVSENLARALLIKNGWGRQEAIDALVSDPDYIFKTFRFDLSTGNKKANLGNSEFTCPVCFCDC